MYFFCECKADKRERRAPDLRQYLVCPQVRPSRARGLLRTWIDIQGSRGTDGRPGLGPVWSCIHVQKGSTNSIKHSHTMLQGTFHRAACTHHDLLQEQIASMFEKSAMSCAVHVQLQIQNGIKFEVLCFWMHVWAPSCSSHWRAASSKSSWVDTILFSKSPTLSADKRQQQSRTCSNKTFIHQVGHRVVRVVVLGSFKHHASCLSVLCRELYSIII